jgi:hypothetical protein
VERFQSAELERRQLDPQTLDLDGAVAGVEQRGPGYAELGGREVRQPAVDRFGTEVERGEVEGDVADDNRLFQWGEAERDERGHERLGVGHHEVEPAQVRAHHEVVTLDVEHGRGLDGTRRLASAHGEEAAVHERLLARWQRVASCVGEPRGDDWIVSFERGRDGPPLAGDGAPGDATGTVTDDAHRVRRPVRPPIEDGGAIRRVVLGHSARMAGMSSGRAGSTE